MNQISSNQVIIALVALGIVLFNVSIVYALLTGSARRQFAVFQRLFRGVRRPWGDEQDSLNELRQRVQRLTDDKTTPPTDG